MYPHKTDDAKYFSKLHSPLWPKVPQSQLFPFSVNIYSEFCLLSLILKKNQTYFLIAAYGPNNRGNEKRKAAVTNSVIFRCNPFEPQNGT